MNRINAVIRDVDAALVRCGSREGMEAAVCRRLTDADLYRFAWIGSYDVATDSVVPRAWDGAGEGYLDDRPDVVGDDALTAGTAVRTGEIQVAQDIAHEPAVAAWREPALEHGFESAIAIPLAYRDLDYGVLCVYAPRPNAFDEVERSVLDELGETVAHAFNALDRRRALLTEGVTELSLEVRDRSALLVGVAERADVRVDLDGVVQHDDGSVVAFLTVAGEFAVDRVTSIVGEYGSDATVVSDDGDELLLRAVVDRTFVSELAKYGGSIDEAVATDGVGRYTAAFPADTDLRAVLDAISVRYDEVAVRAQRQHDREPTAQTGGELRTDLDEALTERQRTVLEYAYLSGFFESPRDSTGVSIAEALDVAPPTFHEHVRTAERKLLDVYFAAG